MITALLWFAAGCGLPDHSDDTPTNTAPSSAASGLPEEDFAGSYADLYCTTLVQCHSPYRCSTASTSTTATNCFAPCDYDALAAQACIEDPWTCGADDMPVPADACGEVYACPATATLPCE